MIDNENKLDETGFEFTGDDGKEYLCKLHGELPWFFYKHPDGEWVSLKQVGTIEVVAAYKRSRVKNAAGWKFTDVVFVDSSLRHIDWMERATLYDSILKLIQYSYKDEARNFEENPSEDHIMIHISRIRSIMFPNKEVS